MTLLFPTDIARLLSSFLEVSEMEKGIRDMVRFYAESPKYLDMCDDFGEFDGFFNTDFNAEEDQESIVLVVDRLTIHPFGDQRRYILQVLRVDEHCEIRERIEPDASEQSLSPERYVECISHMVMRLTESDPQKACAFIAYSCGVEKRRAYTDQDVLQAIVATPAHSSGPVCVLDRFFTEEEQQAWGSLLPLVERGIQTEVRKQSTAALGHDERNATRGMKIIHLQGGF